MKHILSVLLGGWAFGAVIAWTWGAWPVPPGLIGAVMIIVTALLVRRHWLHRRQVTGNDPGARERQAWHAMAGIAVICGHLMGSLATGLNLHVGSGNSLASDNWALVGGVVIAWLALRPRSMDRDERDREMANRGARAGFATMMTLQIVLLTGLGFAPPRMLDQIDPFVIGNALVVVILLALLARYAAQLNGYWQASHSDPDDA